MKKQVLYTIAVLLITISCQNNSIKSNAEIITDADGNQYKTIVIHGKVWLAENLRTTHYSNGDPIPNLKNTDKWNSTNGGAYCAYNNDTSTIKEIGLLYNLYAVIDPRGICPKGYHIATREDWRSISTDEYVHDIIENVKSNKLFNHKVLGWRRAGDYTKEYNSFFDETQFKSGGDQIYWMNNIEKILEPDSEDSVIRAHAIPSVNEYYWGCRNDGYSCRCVKDSI